MRNEIFSNMNAVWHERTSKQACKRQSNQPTNERTLGKWIIRACVMCTYHMVRLCGSWVICVLVCDRVTVCCICDSLFSSVQFICVVLQFKELFVESSGALCRSTMPNAYTCTLYKHSVSHLLTHSLFIHMHTETVLYTHSPRYDLSFFLSFILFIFISLPRYHLEPKSVITLRILLICMDERVWFMYYFCWYWCIYVYCHTKIEPVCVCLFFVHKPIHMEHYRFKMWIEYLSSLFLYVTWFILSRFVTTVRMLVTVGGGATTTIAAAADALRCTCSV